MKSKISHVLVFFLFAFLSFTACQDEETDVVNPNEQEAILSNSSLASLISSTSANFGAADNILDGASCISVELPVTIIVSDITIVIETEIDLEQLEDLFEDLNTDEDFLDFVFPITIIFSDYTELVIENEDQLENLINECDDEDDVIECVDFIYPISFSVFNSEFNLIDTVVIENDEALYEFLDNLEEDENALIVSLNYPVMLEYADGETVEVNSNEQLVDAIQAAEEYCDDEEEGDCSEEEIAINLIECPWEVFLYSNNDLENLSGPYLFNFSADGTMVLEGFLQDPYTTTWELTETDNGLELNINSFYYYEQEFGTWLVVECDDDELKFEHLTVDGTGLFFEQECEDDLDCSVTDISGILQECPWDFTDGTDAYNNYQMVFNANGELLITEGAATSAVGGAWDLSLSNDGLPEIVISNLTAFQDDLEGSWIIIECDEDGALTIIRGTTIIELEQDCGGDLVCPAAGISEDIIECTWEFETNLINSVVPIYVNFTPNGQILDSNNNDTGDEMGTWAIVLVGSDIFFDFTFQQGFEVLNGLWEVVECTEGELYLLSGNNYISLDQDCDLNNDDVFNCFGDFEIVECAQPNNVPVYNLSANTIGLIDCQFPFTASFHTTQADAEINVNPIENTEAYGTLVAQVYLRIVAESGNFEIFNIYLNTEECNAFDCFMDAEIRACIENNDGIATFNLTEVNQECGPDIGIYGIYYFESESDAQNNVNPITNPESYTNTVNPTTIFAAILNVNSNVIEHIFTITLIPESCNLFECFESFDAVIELCDEGNDGFEIFNLTYAFANCTPSADEVTYYEVEADAEAGINVITNAEVFINSSIEQQVYARVEINNQFEVFPILLLLEDCNQGDCSEEDVDSFLVECIWNAVNYNGSDNLAEYNFDFESSNQIVVIYTETQTIDASWSTSQSNDGVIVEFSNVAGPNIQAITGEWLVVECDAARLELHRGDDVLVLERNCD